jgi:hypothetical protein
MWNEFVIQNILMNEISVLDGFAGDQYQILLKTDSSLTRAFSDTTRGNTSQFTFWGQHYIYTKKKKKKSKKLAREDNGITDQYS